MSDQNEGKEHKQVTQAVADQPQEEFISPENLPSKDVTEVTKEDRPREPLTRESQP